MTTSKPKMTHTQLRRMIKTLLIKTPAKQKDLLEFMYAAHLFDGIVESFYDPKNPGPLKTTNDALRATRIELLSMVPVAQRQNLVETVVRLRQYTDVVFIGKPINWCTGVICQWLGRLVYMDYIRVGMDGCFIDAIKELLKAMDDSNNLPHEVHYDDWKSLESHLQEFDLFRTDVLDPHFPEAKEADIRDLLGLRPAEDVSTTL